MAETGSAEPSSSSLLPDQALTSRGGDLFELFPQHNSEGIEQLFNLKLEKFEPSKEQKSPCFVALSSEPLDQMAM
ncbi:MAG: hypothetical protein NZL95_00630 [Chitinophagales bacterium]|nr:hypothetical protein [Chitinophagales bacterium]MDW8427044.1 hypothetical protein [Chitinophagales bacterium]